MLVIGLTRTELYNRINNKDPENIVFTDQVNSYTTVSLNGDPDFFLDVNLLTPQNINSKFGFRKFDVITFDWSTIKFLKIEKVILLKQLLKRNGSMWIPREEPSIIYIEGLKEEYKSPTLKDNFGLMEVSMGIFNDIVHTKENVNDNYFVITSALRKNFLNEIFIILYEHGFIQVSSTFPLLVKDHPKYTNSYWAIL